MPMANGTFIVAEIGASHQQVFQKAKDLICAAGEAGADAVKIQMFTADDMTLKGRFKIKDGLWKGWDLYELYEKATLPYEWIPELKRLAEDMGLVFFTTVYHPDTVAIAEELGIGMYKIASFEIPYLELIEKVAETLKPVIISTGMADYDEIDKAVTTVKKVHNDITLLKCTSSYPATLEELNLNTIPNMAISFDVPVGLSDHTKGVIAPMIAIALGATVIEKHLTLKEGEGLDGGFATPPETFRGMVGLIRDTEKCLGQIAYGGKKNFRREKVEGRMVRVC